MGTVLAKDLKVGQEFIYDDIKFIKVNDGLPEHLNFNRYIQGYSIEKNIVAIILKDSFVEIEENKESNKSDFPVTFTSEISLAQAIPGNRFMLDGSICIRITESESDNIQIFFTDSYMIGLFPKETKVFGCV